MKKVRLTFFMMAGLLFSCQSKEEPASFADETTISTLVPKVENI